MKYLITESKISELIKDYILKNYDDVADVEFNTKRVQLGSGPNDKGESIINRKVITITINNLNKRMNIDEVKEIKNSILRNLNNVFNVDSGVYGSEWELKFYQIKKVEI